MAWWKTVITCTLCLLVVAYIITLSVFVGVTEADDDDEPLDGSLCDESTECPEHPSVCFAYECYKADTGDTCILTALQDEICVTSGSNVEFLVADCSPGSCTTGEVQQVYVDIGNAAESELGIPASQFDLLGGSCGTGSFLYTIHLRDTQDMPGSADALMDDFLAALQNQSSPLAQAVDELNCEDPAQVLDGPSREQVASQAPTAAPTASPTVSPTLAPTVSPTLSPTVSPTLAPTVSPTKSPTPSPTDQPTPQPTDSPTQQPTEQPTPQPTDSPTASPL